MTKDSRTRLFFLSGLFFSEGKSLGSFVRKKAKFLLIPLLFFFVLGALTSVIKNFLAGDNFFSIDTYRSW